MSYRILRLLCFVVFVCNAYRHVGGIEVSCDTQGVGWCSAFYWPLFALKGCVVHSFG